MVSELTLPAVLTKYDLVHREGIFLSWGNSSLSAWEVAPFMYFRISGMGIWG